MRDAIGGVVNITFIAIFMIVVSAYLAFTVSYNRAFKVKNKVISILEQYEHFNEPAKSAIKEYNTRLGYSGQQGFNLDGYTCPSDLQGICIKWTQDTESTEAGLPKGYYSVVTAVEVNIPIFNKFLPFMTVFQTSGDTMTINATN